jgi:dimeric dUTPase (all-alpha-NTP-PPase superfamily)
MAQDMLEQIFALQQRFDDSLITQRGLEDITPEEWIQKETLAMMSELAELIDEVNFKWWKNPRPVDNDRVKGELVDVLHFFVSMCLKTGMDARELCDRYIEKNQVNFLRQQGKTDKPGYAMEQADPG